MDKDGLLQQPSPSDSPQPAETPSRPSSILGEEGPPSRQNAAPGERHNTTPSTKKRQRQSTPSSANSVLSMIGERISASREEDEFDSVGRTVAAKLRKMAPHMQIIAEKLIHEVLYEGQIGSLKPHAKITVAAVHQNP